MSTENQNPTPTPTTTKPTVLITGCSDGGLGSALALAFHDAGFHVYATARDGAKMSDLYAYAAAAHRSGALETLPLDVQSAASIAACVARVPRLDVLVNNAGAMMTMPVADVAIAQAKAIFDVNVWGVLAVTQAFLPLLLESARRRRRGERGAGVGGIVAVNTSVASTVPVPFYGVYGASKAAMAMLCDTMRLELEAFGVHVVELKTGAVGPTRLIANNTSLLQSQSQPQSLASPNTTTAAPILPEKSIYAPAREVVEGIMRRGYDGAWMPPAEWARQVVQDLSGGGGKGKAPARIWRGKSALLGWLVQFLPSALVAGSVKRETKYTQVEEILRLARIYPGNDAESIKKIYVDDM
ncbi:NAD(P)-binding protein [Apiospora arundinis]|uniref:NAD(P)-binding protein n=1 Tax=Apiospora arundinis TaxID=335852 RepID=A0ABR2JGK6_9PEZI